MSVRTATPEVPRTLRHLDTDKQWAERDTASKLYCTAVDAAHRLRGLADVLYCEALTLSEPDPGVLTGIDPGTC
jgi:hypothetical protein